MDMLPHGCNCFCSAHLEIGFIGKSGFKQLKDEVLEIHGLNWEVQVD